MGYPRWSRRLAAQPARELSVAQFREEILRPKYLAQMSPRYQEMDLESFAEHEAILKRGFEGRVEK
jgi:hypothetical protein